MGATHESQTNKQNIIPSSVVSLLQHSHVPPLMVSLLQHSPVPPLMVSLLQHSPISPPVQLIRGVTTPTFTYPHHWFHYSNTPVVSLFQHLPIPATSGFTTPADLSGQPSVRNLSCYVIASVVSYVSQCRWYIMHTYVNKRDELVQRG